MSTDITYVWILLHLYESVYEIEAVYGREEDANAAMDSRRKPADYAVEKWAVHGGGRD